MKRETMNLNRRSFVFGMSLTTLYMVGCSANMITNTSSSAKKELDTSKLQSLIEQLETDLDVYEMDEDMRAYSSRVSKAMSLLTSGNATQDEIDKAVEEIEALRKVVVNKEKPPEPTASFEGMDYESFVNSAQDNVGNIYHVEGYVTRTSGGFRGADYQTYVYWDETMTEGEVLYICIPYKAYKKDVNKYFSGNCVFQGIDEDGHPLFICDTEYESR